VCPAALLLLVACLTALASAYNPLVADAVLRLLDVGAL
jgi:hypothetical protein